MQLIIPVDPFKPDEPMLRIVLERAMHFAPWLQPTLVGVPTLGSIAADYGAEVIPFMGSRKGEPVANTDKVMRAVCERGETFVWSNDDIFWLEETSLEDLRHAGEVAMGSLAQASPGGSHGRIASLTRRTLEKMKRPTWNYERHVPIVVEPEAMLEALAHRGTAKRSMYQNLRHDQPREVADDVKVFSSEGLRNLPAGPFVSVGNRVSAADVQRFLG